MKGNVQHYLTGQQFEENYAGIWCKMVPRELSYVAVWPAQVMYGLPNYPLLWVTTLSVMGIEEATPKKITQEICKEAEEKKVQQECNRPY